MRQSVRSPGRSLGAGVTLLAATLATAPAPAQDATAPATRPPARPSWETWVGAEATHQSWSIYSGVTLAPFGSVQADGLRLRTVTGYGRYDYLTHSWTGTGIAPRRVDGTAAFADILLGYHWELGPVTVKVLAGLATEGHWLSPDDPGNIVQGTASGAKAMAEGWLNWTDAAWSSLDLAWTTAHDGRSARLRSGYRLHPWISVGLESGYAANASHEAGRGGLFVRSEWAHGEMSASAGVTADRDGIASPYGTVNWLVRY